MFFETYRSSTWIPFKLERNSNETWYQEDGKQLEAVVARQGLVVL